MDAQDGVESVRMEKRVMGDNALLVDVRGLAKMLSISKREIERMAVDGRLPPPIRLGKRMVRWRLDTIRRWAEELEQTAAKKPE